MTTLNLIILSYHKFSWEADSYQYSRTYKDFDNDLRTKTFDMITIDDASESIMKACDMLKDFNIRAKLFVSTALVETKGYCTWKQLIELSKFHDIENHSHNHVHLPDISHEKVKENIVTASYMIEKTIGKKPRFFVPPFNKSSKFIDDFAYKYGMQIIKNRVDILNTTP